MPETQPAARPAFPDHAAEAARYALLRRLAPSMRHHLVVNLQPIGMIYEVLDRRLRAPEPDLESVQDSAQKINGFARAALHSCLDVVSWLAPEEKSTTRIEDGARECASLLATSLSFRGYALRNEVAPLQGELRRAAVRNLLTAALVQATDNLPPPAELVLTAQEHATGVKLQLDVKSTEGEKGFTTETGYRPLQWADVQALAIAENAEAIRDGNRISLLIPWAGQSRGHAA